MLNKQELEQTLSDFKIDIKLIKISVPEEVNLILNLTRKDLFNRSSEELAVDAIQLAQYSASIHNEKNKCEAVKVWAEANLKSIIGRELENYTGYGYQEKSVKISRNDEQAHAFFKLIATMESKIASIAEIDKKIDFIVSSIKNLCFVKKGTNYA